MTNTGYFVFHKMYFRISVYFHRITSITNHAQHALFIQSKYQYINKISTNHYESC